MAEDGQIESQDAEAVRETKTLTETLIVLLVIPVIAFATAKGVQWHFDRLWWDAVREQVGPVSPETRPDLALRNFCQRSDMAGQAVCTDLEMLDLMASGSVVAALLGTGLLGAISLAGGWSINNRAALLTLYKPGLYLTLFVVVGLVVLSAVLAIGSIYYGESALINRIHVGVIFGIGAGALLGVLGVIRASFGILRPAQFVVVGTALDRASEPRLHKFVENLANRMGSASPDTIVAGLDPNFFVTEARVRCLNNELKGRTLYLSLPLCRLISQQEFKAVLAHEFSHFRGQDTLFSQKFYPIYRGTTDAILALANRADEGVRSIPLLPAIHILLHFYQAFVVAENAISRERELVADAAAAKVAGPKAIGSALIKLHAFSGLWEGMLLAMRQALSEGKQFVNVSQVFADWIRDQASPVSLPSLDEQRVPHPTDSHPPLRVRLDALRLSLEQLEGLALQIEADKSAIALLANGEAIEQQLSDVEHALLAQSIAASHSPEDTPRSNSWFLLGNQSTRPRGH